MIQKEKKFEISKYLLLQNFLDISAKWIRLSSVFKEIISENVKACANCFKKVYKGCDDSASQSQYSRRVKVANLMEIRGPTTI